MAMIEREEKKTASKKRQTGELAAQLAPLEEQKVSESTTQNGVIKIGSKENKKIPTGLSGDESDDAGTFRIDNAMFLVLIFALMFIAFIAYLVSQMPEQK